MEYDDVIVGGGSVGAVLGARLSEDPARTVLLLEAGPDYATVESTPTDLRDCWRMSLRDHDWGFTAEAVPGREIPYPRGRVIGGSSAVNAAIALRGVPADYDEWASLGNAAWSWKNVLPYFRRLEDDPIGAAEVHGRHGPIVIRRWQEDELIPTQRAFLEVCRRLGFPEVAGRQQPAGSALGRDAVHARQRLTAGQERYVHPRSGHRSRVRRGRMVRPPAALVGPTPRAAGPRRPQAGRSSRAPASGQHPGVTSRATRKQAVRLGCQSRPSWLPLTTD